jgi:hypothetical protein
VSDRLSRLRGLPPERFGAVIEEAIDSQMDHSDVQSSPPTPAGAIDLIARHGGTVQLYHARQQDANGVVDVPTVRELVAFRDSRNAQTATLLVTGAVSAGARELAAAENVAVFAGKELTTFLEERNVAIPDAERAVDVADIAERFTSQWPEQLRLRADAIVDGIEQFGDFEHRVRRGDDYTEVAFADIDTGRPLVGVRFTETSLRVLVWDGLEFDRVVALNTHHEELPEVETLLERLRAALETVDNEEQS